MIITNDFKSSTISITDPADENNTIDLYLYRNKKNNIKVDIVNGAPYVTINCHLYARISSINNNEPNSSNDRLKAISDAANKYLESHISEYLYRTSKVFKSDICGIGKYAIKNFWTTKQWNGYNWPNNYQNAFFKVNVDTSVKSGFLLTES